MGKILQTDEARVSQAINSATQEIAGKAKGISNTPITLLVKKHGVPDLTLKTVPHQIKNAGSTPRQNINVFKQC